MLAGALLGAGFGWYRTRYTEAQATVLVNPLAGNPFSASGDDLTNLETEAQLVKSVGVSERVITATGSTLSPAELVEAVEVNVPTNTQLVEIIFQSVNADEAVQATQAFATEFLAFREERARSQADEQSSSIQEQVQARTKERANLLDDLAGAGTQAKEAALQAQVDSLTAQIATLRSRIAELKVGPFDPGQVVTPAAVVETGVLGSWPAFAGLGAVLGLIVALGVAVVRARVDNSVHHPDDITFAGRTIAGNLTRIEAHQALAEFVEAPTAGPVSVAFRDLRVTILTSIQTRPLAILAASSGADASAVPAFAPGLALALARADLNTVVLDTVGGWADESVLGSGRSLDDLLHDDGQLPELADRNPVVFRVAPDGDAEDLFLSPAMSRLMHRLRQHADVILVISGSLKSSRSRALATNVDAVLTEIVEGVSNQDDVRLENPTLKAKDLGVVYVTGAPPRAVGSDPTSRAGGTHPGDSGFGNSAGPVEPPPAMVPPPGAFGQAGSAPAAPAVEADLGSGQWNYRPLSTGGGAAGFQSGATTDGAAGRP